MDAKEDESGERRDTEVESQREEHSKRVSAR